MDIQTLKRLSQEEAFSWASQFSGVPADVLDGLWAAESGRGKNMRSPAGAEGHFQLMPQTRARFEKQLGVTVNPDDFHEALFIAAHHLRDDMQREKGQVDNALRAYNNGPNWRKQKDPRGENAAYAQRVLAQAGRSAAAANAESAARIAQQVKEQDFAAADFETLGRKADDRVLADYQRKSTASTADLATEVFGDSRVFGAKWLNDRMNKPAGQGDFDYYAWADREKYEAQAQNPQEMMFLRENISGPDTAEWAMEQLKVWREKDKKYGDYGATEQFLVNAGVSLADPVGFAIGLGAGKAFGLSRASLRAMSSVSSRAAVAGRIVGTAALEGAAGNAGFELFQDLTGQVKSAEDYILASAFGAGFAGTLAPFAVKGALRELEPQMVGHVEAFRRAEVERLAAVDAQARKVDPVQQARDLGELADTGRVGGTARRAESKVIPDELLVRSVDEDADPLATDPVVQAVQAKEALVQALAEPVAAPAATAQAATAGGPSATELQLQRDIIRAADRFADRDATVNAISEQMGTLMQSNGSIPRRGTAKRDKWEALAVARREAREAAVQAYHKQRELQPDLRGPVTENLDPVADGAGRQVQPLAKESLYDALISARSAPGVKAHDVEMMNLLLRNMDAGVLRGVEVNYAPGQVRGIWRPMFREIVVPGDARGGAGMEAGRASVLVHEGVHAAVQRVIADVFAGKQASPQAFAAVSRLRDIYVEFRSELAERGIRASGEANSNGAAYAGSDIQEFVAQAMMDADTQRILSEMKGAKYEDDSLWDRFWRAVTEALGIAADKGTALYDTVRQMEVLVRSGGVLPDGVTLREPLPELRSGTESPAARSNRDSNFFRQLYAHARAWTAGNPVDPVKLQTLANKYTSGAVRDTAVSDGLKMASSKNPIVRMLSGLIVEVTTGAAGRRTTADLLNHLYHHRIIGSSVNEYDHAATSWVKKNGGGWVERMATGRVDQRFDRLVAEEILRRRNEQTAPVDPEVKAAADAMQRLFQRSLDQQKRSGTLGSAWLPDDARGYMPQALKGDAIRGMGADERAMLSNALAEHWRAHYKWDKRFADEFAKYYITRAMREAAGEKHVDHVATTGATSVVKDVLAEMRLEMRSLDARTAGELERVGGAPYTKHRLDVPLLDALPNGKTFMDYYDTDIKKLARGHARSVAGQAALAEHNILGQRGVNNLLRAIREAEPGDAATPEEVSAVERTFSAFLGTPWHGEHRNRLASGLSAFTRLRLMGGLAFTQLGELVNGLHMVGMGATMEAAAALPRMFSEVRAAVKGAPLANKWLGSIDRFSGYELGTEQFRMSSAFDAPDDLLREYGKGANIVERAIHSGNYAQAKVSLFRGLHAAQHRAFAEQIVQKAVDYLSKPDAASDRYLDDMGFNAEMRKALRSRLDQAVQRDDAGNATGFDVFALDNPELMEDFVSAVNRGTAQIIQDTFIGEKGAWAHSDLQKLAFQLRTFGLTATEKQWARNRMLAGPGVEGYAFAAGVLMGQMALVTPIYLARLQVNALNRDDRDAYIEQGLAPAALVQAMMNYSSAGGLAGDAFDTVASMAGGWNDDLKEGLGVKSFGSGVGGLVPGLGTVDQGIRVAAGNGSAAQALKLLPGSNLPYVQAVINAAR